MCQIPCDLDVQFAGLAEAWAAGVSWSDLVRHGGGLDEGDIARLLRRTLDLLTQVGEEFETVKSACCIMFALLITFICQFSAVLYSVGLCLYLLFLWFCM